MKSIGTFLRTLRAKKEIADAARKGAVLGANDGSKHRELSKRAEGAALVALSAERAGAPPEVLQTLGQEALSAAAERDQFFEQEKSQIVTARNEAEEREREGK